MKTQGFEGVGLRQLFPGCRMIGAADIPVRSCTDRWEHITPGDLFVARAGREDDGHEAAGRAVAQGAAAVLAERPVPVNVPICLVDDTREALGTLCHRLAGEPSQSLRVIGVTGSYGKGAVCELIKSILKAAGESAAIGALQGERPPRAMLSSMTPLHGAADVANWLVRLSDSGIQNAIVYGNSVALAERALAGAPLDAGVLTNLSSPNIDFHGNAANYQRAERRLLNQLQTQGVAAVNEDDVASRNLLSSLERPSLSIGLGSDAQITATLLDRHPSEQTFLIEAGNDSVPVCTNTIGDDHIRQCLLATAAALGVGIDLPTIARGLESLHHLPSQLERVECGQPFSVFLDAAKSPRRLAAAISTLKSLRPGRLICVCSADEVDSRENLAALGRVAERGSDHVVLTNASPHDTRDLHAIHDLLDGFRRPAAAVPSPNRQRAIRYALEQAQPGDCVLICGQVLSEVTNSAADLGVAQEDEEVVRSSLGNQPILRPWTLGASCN